MPINSTLRKNIIEEIYNIKEIIKKYDEILYN